jgi:O-antigen/teichoic acid export membrane protein
MNDNKKIALNTIVLYFRLIIRVLIELYVSRIVLLALGIDDFGLYSVIGGIVTMMNILGSSMLSTSYRFITVEIGKGPLGNVNKVYNTVFVIHLFIAVLLLLIGETIGVYYINNYLRVAVDKIPDALYVLHFSLLSTVLVIISYPSNGVIIAREKFVFTSSVEIGREIIKLTLVICLSHYIGNKLRMFAVIMLLFNAILPICYTAYCCIKESNNVKWKFNKNIADYKEIFSYSAWIMLGASACMVQNEGAAVLVNSFFTLMMNAAFGVATQVNTCVQMFVKSLGQATVPQIMKSYSAGNQKRTMSLVFLISKYSFFLMLVTSVPLLVSVDDILVLWLKKVPEYTKYFILFMLINGIVYTLECGFDSCIQATGKVKKNQIGYSLIGLSVFPIAYLLYKNGMPPYTITIVSIVASACTIVFHTYILKQLTDFTYRQYFHVTLLPAIRVSLPIITLAFLIRYYLVISNVWICVIIKSLLSIIIVITTVYMFGISKNERGQLKNTIRIR